MAIHESRVQVMSMSVILRSTRTGTQQVPFGSVLLPTRPTKFAWPLFKTTETSRGTVSYGSTSGANDDNNNNNNHPPWAHWFIVVFLPLRRLAALNLFRTIDPCHGSIVQKKMKQLFHHLQGAEAYPAFSPPWRRKRRISFDLGGIFA
jgi:hypothetical protein